MMYPGDPLGSFGPEYPKGFEKYYMLVLIAVVALGVYWFN